MNPPPARPQNLPFVALIERRLHAAALALLALALLFGSHAAQAQSASSKIADDLLVVLSATTTPVINWA